METTSLRYCNNCGKQGHVYNNCKIPITSYGVILYRVGSRGIEFLMARRRNTYGFLEVIRGKYPTDNLTYLKKMIDQMTLDEKQCLATKSFPDLWKKVWGYPIASSKYTHEEHASSEKLSNVREQIKDIVEHSNTCWVEPEWGFPKGRRNSFEKDQDCALREFEEETGISIKYLNLIENILPFEEIFIGSNMKSYKHKYYLAQMDYNVSIKLNYKYQESEISAVEWKTFEECVNSIRDYNLEKKDLIRNVYRVIQKYNNNN